MSEVRKWPETIGLAQYPHIVAGVSVYLIVLALITFVSAIGAPCLFQRAYFTNYNVASAAP